MKTASTCAAVSNNNATAFSVSDEIERFLDGESDGHEILSLLYGAVADEPVPERLRALVHRHCPRLVVG
jgi:hypothetical protein